MSLDKPFPLALCLLACLPISPAFAQTSPDVPAWSVQGNVTVDLFSNLRGGIKKGSRTMENVAVQVNYDGTAHGLRGIKASIGALYNGDRSFSVDLVGDLQGISNIETGTEALRPCEVWISKEFGEEGSYLKLGLIDLNGTFDTPGVSGLFINPSHGIVPSFSQSGLNGPSIFPTLGLAVVGEAALGGGLKVRAGVFDPVPGEPLRPKRTDLRWDKDDGILGVLEVEQSGESWRWALGGWTYSQTSADSLASLQDSNSGFYGNVDYYLTQSTSAFLRAGTAKKDFNVLDRYVGAGFVWAGPFASRVEDEFGFAIAHGRTTPLARDFGLAKTETNFEVTYAAPLGNGFIVQGDVQYVLNPATDDTTKDAWVAGLRLTWEFGPD